MIYPQYQRMEDHPFDLSGLLVGDRFIGCIKCGFQLSPTVKVCVLECPTCLSRMTDYIVTEDDLK